MSDLECSGNMLILHRPVKTGMYNFEIGTSVLKIVTENTCWY
jgi:hypothetical protein